MNEPPRQLPSSSNAISSISAMPMPSASPPCTWPSTIIGLIRTPQSSTAMNRRTLTCTGAGVDVHDADVGAEREGQVRRVVDGRGVQMPLDALGQLEATVRGQRDLLDRLALVGVAVRRTSGPSPTPGRRPTLRASPTRRSWPGRGPCGPPPPSRHRTPASNASRRCPGRTASGRCRRARRRCRPARCPAPRRRSARTSSRGPGPATAPRSAAPPCRSGAPAAPRRRPCRGRGCPCACAGPAPTASVKKLRPMPVSIATLRRLELRALLGLLGPQLVVTGHLQCHRSVLRVVAGVVLPAGRAVVRELLGPQQVLHPQLGRVDLQLVAPARRSSAR